MCLTTTPDAKGTMAVTAPTYVLEESLSSQKVGVGVHSGFAFARKGTPHPVRRVARRLILPSSVMEADSGQPSTPG